MTVSYFRVASDLHIEVNGYNPKTDLPPMLDDHHSVLLLAGDLLGGLNTKSEPKIVEAFQDWSDRFLHVVFILGNHDYWFNNYDSAVEKWKILASKFHNVTLLTEGEAYIHNNIPIIGATYWTDFAECGPSAQGAWCHIGDSKYIFDHTHAEQIQLRHKIDQHGIIRTCRDLEGVYQRPIIMTHHAPSYLSVHEKWKGNPLNPCFVNDHDELVKALSPMFWVHGHVHNNFSYCINGTDVVCNPRGYKDENLKDYKPTTIAYSSRESFDDLSRST